ncbi:MAG: hypothetical protein LBM67_00740 [Lentimicrobiaceae bacterium]|nr:hypothetical protein [Lentimicrobiaceae bacterium]
MTLFMTLGATTMFAQQEEMAPWCSTVFTYVTSPHLQQNGMVYFEIINSPYCEFDPQVLVNGIENHFCCDNFVSPSSLIKVRVVIGQYIAQYYGPIQYVMFFDDDFVHISQTIIEIEDRPIMDTP